MDLSVFVGSIAIKKSKDIFTGIEQRQILISRYNNLSFFWDRFSVSRSEFILNNFPNIFSSTAKEKILKRNKKLDKI